MQASAGLGSWAQAGPGASYVACLAVKCAERQSEKAGELFLRALRAAAQRPSHPLAHPEALSALAEEVAAQAPAVFNAASFGYDMAANAGEAALQEDLRQAHVHRIDSPPTIVLFRGTEPGRMIRGCWPYEALLQALAHLAPDLFYVPSLVDGGAG